MASIIPKPDFDVKTDCKMLHSVMEPSTARKAPDATARSLIQILTTRSYDQRQEIVASYREYYGRYLAQDVRSCVSSSGLREGLLTLVRPYSVRDASAIHKALTCRMVDEHTLLEIMASRDFDELQDICDSYKDLFKVELWKAIKSELSGNLEAQMTMMLTDRRSRAPVEEVRVREATRELHNVSRGKWKDKKHQVASKFRRESFGQLRAIFNEYERLYGESIEDLVERDMRGHIGRLVGYLMRFARSEVCFYAWCLHKALRGELGDKSPLQRAVMGHSCPKTVVTRIVLSRCDVDMLNIITAYEETYGSCLRGDICAATHGELRDLLMAACGWSWPVKGHDHHPRPMVRADSGFDIAGLLPNEMDR
ncbi:hypothetical protein CBR_g41151 [Chara braunii]|uniref:Annexin n=1 Tax=Chara braunii TaxID=69332 RepID=A0A388K2F0_CHABU|nr:hypothetical protein CBR_g41151 [Chara braunii]|eukprot:GBG64230.1 hypothetical protein CBR_g41151 [Chara braunii]